MLIARGTGGEGNELLLLCLSRRNIEELFKGRPIRLTTATHGEAIPAHWTIGILAGETEEAMQAELEKSGLLSGAEVIDDARLNDAPPHPLGLGPTGRFPEGKMPGRDDQGELKAALHIEGDKIMLEFGKPVAWLALTPEEAMEMALHLRKQAKQLRRKP